MYESPVEAVQRPSLHLCLNKKDQCHEAYIQSRSIKTYSIMKFLPMKRNGGGVTAKNDRSVNQFI